jgi:hypothetical protein
MVWGKVAFHNLTLHDQRRPFIMRVRNHFSPSPHPQPMEALRAFFSNALLAHDPGPLALDII